MHEQKELTVDTSSDGFWVLFNEEDLSKCQLLIIGPDDTPYEGGFFHFDVKLPDKYPFENPKCTYLTTGQGKVRFNPNLYKCGKVCLSILGTWSGPAWSSAMGIRTLCMNLQLVLNDAPVHNEPGWENYGKDTDSVCSYNKYVRWNTVKHALIDHMSKKTNLPKEFQTIVDKRVKERNDYYVDLIKKFGELSENPGVGNNTKIYNKEDINAINYEWTDLSQQFADQWDKSYNQPEDRSVDVVVAALPKVEIKN